MSWEWGDLRFFLAVVEAGTTSGAARALGVNQTTCARRISALEAGLGARLFDRTPAGYVPTETGARLVDRAKRVAVLAEEFEKHALDTIRLKSRTVRLTTSDGLAERIALPAIAAFALVRPDIQVTLNVDSRYLDLAAGEADIALRPAQGFDDPRLVIRKVMDARWAFYCGANWQNAPSSLTQALQLPLATLVGKPQEMLMSLSTNLDIRYSSNTMRGLVDTIASGTCVGALPRHVGDENQSLKCCFDLDIDAGVWIVYPAARRQELHLREFIGHLVSFIKSTVSKGID